MEGQAAVVGCYEVVKVVGCEGEGVKRREDVEGFDDL